MATLKVRDVNGNWVEVKGSTGPQGEQGPAGNDGATGPEGPAGPEGPVRGGAMFAQAVEPNEAVNGDLWVLTG